MLSIIEDLSGMSLAVFTRLLGWNLIELELFLADVKAEWKRKGIHAYWPAYVLLVITKRIVSNYLVKVLRLWAETRRGSNTIARRRCVGNQNNQATPLF